jgi:hypothetical protein
MRRGSILSGMEFWSPTMLDLVYVVGGCLFFGVSVFYALACDRL